MLEGATESDTPRGLLTVPERDDPPGDFDPPSTWNARAGRRNSKE